MQMISLTRPNLAQTLHVCAADCFSMPMMIHVVVALLSTVTFASVALLLTLADHELKVCRDFKTKLNCQAFFQRMFFDKSIIISVVISNTVRQVIDCFDCFIYSLSRQAYWLLPIQ